MGIRRAFIVFFGLTKRKKALLLWLLAIIGLGLVCCILLFFRGQIIQPNTPAQFRSMIDAELPPGTSEDVVWVWVGQHTDAKYARRTQDNDERPVIMAGIAYTAYPGVKDIYITFTFDEQHRLRAYKITEGDRF